jgi:glycosyltransferase involved in cell wall biosynthesis
MKTAEPKTDFSLSVVIPAYNEQEVLPEFHRRLDMAVRHLAARRDYIFVNDGSTDDTLATIQRLRTVDSRVSIIDLSRNYGKEIAMTAGLDHADGDAVVIIDADLQDPPELIPELVARWGHGYDVVYARRTERKGETLLKRATAYLFYRLLQRLGSVRIPEDTGDFRLLSRRAVRALRRLRERHRFMKGLYAWIGYPQASVEYQRSPRQAGRTKWDFWRLWNFALEGITSFSVIPLKLSTYLGFVTALAAFLYGTFIIAKAVLFGDPVAGFPTLFAFITFLGGVQLVAIGIIGEYLGRVFDEVKQRPLYLVNALMLSNESAPSGDTAADAAVGVDV